MATPLIMLAILGGSLLAGVLLRTMGFRVGLNSAGAMGLAAVFLFTASGHFVETHAMVEMIPPFVPARVPLVYLTGLLEIAIAAGIALNRTRRLAGMAAIAVLVGFFPFNIYAAGNYTGMGGHQWGPVYLLIRAPLQIVLIAWSWHFAVQAGTSTWPKPR
jgi:uncharacterized membrane protein